MLAEDVLLLVQYRAYLYRYQCSLHYRRKTAKTSFNLPTHHCLNTLRPLHFTRYPSSSSYVHPQLRLFFYRHLFPFFLNLSLHHHFIIISSPSCLYFTSQPDHFLLPYANRPKESTLRFKLFHFHYLMYILRITHTVITSPVNV